MRKSIGLWQVLPLIPCPWPTACWSDSGAKHGAVQMKKVATLRLRGTSQKVGGMFGMAHDKDIKIQRVSTFKKDCPKYFAFSIYMGLNMSRCIGQWMAMVKSSSPIFQQVKLVLSGSHWSCIRLEHNSSLRRQCGRGTFQLYYYLLLLDYLTCKKTCQSRVFNGRHPPNHKLKEPMPMS